MEDSIRQLLAQHDDPVGCEVPANDWRAFPYAELAASVVEIQAALLTEVGVKFERDGQVQDASFHDELRVLHPDSHRPNGVTILFSEIAIRFSNFGRMFTIHTGLPEIPAKYPLRDIQSLVERRGWTFVPADQLEETYDGQNPTIRDARASWWIRFFDYL